MRPSQLLVLAALLAAPALAGAERLAIVETAATTSGIDRAEVAQVRAHFETALRETGMDVTAPGRKAVDAEFVTSLSLAKEGSEVVLTAQVSRFRLDLWAARAEVRVQDPTPASIAAAAGDLAGQITLAIQTAPARDVSQPATRPAARKLKSRQVAASAEE